MRSTMTKSKVALLSTALLLGSYSTAMAAEATADSVVLTKAEYQTLMDRLSNLEDRVTKNETKQKVTEAANFSRRKNPAKPKAAKKADDWTFSGDLRARFVDDLSNANGVGYTYRLRVRGEKRISPTMKVVFRNYMMNENETGNVGVANSIDSAGKMTFNTGKDAMNKIDNAYMEISSLYGKKTNTLKIGRFGHSLGTTGFYSSAGSYGMYDGVEFGTQSGKLKWGFGFGDWGASKDPVSDTITLDPAASKASAKGDVYYTLGTDSKDTTKNKLERNYFVKLDYSPSSKDRIYGWHMRETGGNDSENDYNLLGIGIAHTFNNVWKVTADYVNNRGFNDSKRHDGKVAILHWKQASPNKPKSFGARLYYVNVDQYNVAGTTCKSIHIPTNNNSGYGLSFHYTFAKNLSLDVLTEFKMKTRSTGADRKNYYRAQLTARF